MLSVRPNIISSLIVVFALFPWGYGAFAQTGFEYYNVALVKYNIRDYTGAEADLTKAIESDPNHAPAYNLRGMVKYNLDDPEGAIDDYNRAIEIFSRPTEGIRLRVYDQRGNIVEQKPKADPELAIPYYNRALAKTAIGDPEGANDDFTMALKNDPDLINSYYLRGIVRLELGDLNGACSDWKKSVELGLTLAGELLRQHCD
jgi:tetratricopeptide (TPR) repeat protein